MKKLTGIKGCFHCEKREICNLKNSPSNLSARAIRFEHINRGSKRHAKPFIVVTSMCTDFSPEEKQ